MSPKQAGTAAPWRVLPRGVVFALAVVVAVILLQIAARAYQVERGSYSDEAAHFLNGLLLRDYVTHGLGTNPIRFAEDYYVRYPKVAPLVWPPFFHLVLGVFLLPGWPPDEAALVLIAIVIGWLSWRLATMTVQFAPPWIAMTTAALTPLVPVVSALSTAVMADLLVAALALESAYWLARYWASGRLRHAVLFGVAAAACCMTKGNGVAVVLLPLLLAVVTRRARVLTAPGLYVAAAIVVVFAVPPLLLSYRFGLTIGDFSVPHEADFVTRLTYYGPFIWHQLGPLPIGLALMGLAGALADTDGRDGRPPVSAALAALVAAVLVFHEFTPYRYFEGRYFVVLIAPLVGLMARGVIALAALAPRGTTAWRAVLTASAATAIVLTYAQIPARRALGFRVTERHLESLPGTAGGRLLVVSDEPGEGAFVAEAASRAGTVPMTIVRASKLLSAGDWVGGRFALRFSSPDDVTHELEALHVAYVVLDESDGEVEKAVWRLARDQMSAAIARAPERYERIYAVGAESACRRELVVYRVRFPAPGPASPLRLEVSALGRMLTQ